jgi:hypothetical protein
MTWNLADPMSLGLRRRFSLPLASIPPGKDNVRKVDRNLFDLSEHYNNLPPPDGRTADVVLNIRIKKPAGGFTEEDDLPDPLIRLHAMAPGIMRFKPANKAFGDQLILETPIFAGSIPVRWWQRWIEAHCVPRWIIYENVDRNSLENLLRTLPLGRTVYGLSLPQEIWSEVDRDSFVDRFLEGNDKYILDVAESGAFIGTAGSDQLLAGAHLLKLHVRYNGHIDITNPLPMNPREFFNLLFGDDSEEAWNHPLLNRINESGEEGGLESRWMLIRPPLRTYARVVWEADQEIKRHAKRWAAAEKVSSRFYNRYSYKGMSFSRGDYEGAFKCNLFVSDICLRSGFRINIHPLIPENRWHYIDANSYCNRVHSPDPAPANPKNNRIILQGKNDEGKDVPWGWKIENWLRTPGADMQRMINEAMMEEGRCFILAGARKRKFKKIKCIKDK